MNTITIFPFLCLFIISAPMLATLELKDKICAILGTERPILLSDVKKRADEQKVSLKQALQLLLQDRALEHYAKSQQKLNLSSIHESAEKHLKSIMEKNHLNRDAFIAILRKAPYFTTLDSYEEEVAFQIIKNQIETSFAQSIYITDAKVIEAQKALHHGKLEVIFISILPLKTQSKESIISQERKANNISEQLQRGINLDSLKNAYQGQKDISFIGPLDYKVGSLQEHYESVLKENPSQEIIGPFKDKQALTLIVRRAKTLPVDKEGTGLENIRNKLYEESVRLRISAVTKEILENTPIEVNCTW